MLARPKSGVFARSQPHLALLAAFAALAAGNAQAEPASAEAPTLSTVVVTASQREQEIRQAPASISVITREEIAAQPNATLEDVLRGTEGVSVVGSSPNDRDISIRGMPGEYTLILVDGKRQGTRETMNRGTGGVQGNLIPPMSAIERIEVVRGPMSSLYGADAMGGVINIITRKVPKNIGGEVTVGGVWQKNRDHGDSRNVNFWFGAPLKEDVVGLQVSGKNLKREEDDVYYPLNATAGQNGKRDESLAAKLSVKPNAQHDFVFDIGSERLNYDATPGLSNADKVTSNTVVRTEHERSNIGLTHNGRWDFGTSTVALYKERGQQSQWTTLGRQATEPVIDNTVFDARATMPLARNILTFGGQYIWSELDGIANQDSAPGGYAKNTDRVKRNSWALFVEDDFLWTDAFTLTAGARLDNDENYGQHVSPRLYGVYQINSAWTLRGGVASGFKAPTLRQSTAGYCMTTGGAAGATPGTLCGNPDLEPETSVTQEIGLRYAVGENSIGITVFNNDFKNKVTSYDTGKRDPRSRGRNIYQYDNIDQVNLNGVEIGGAWRLLPSWKLSGAYTLTHSERSGDGEKAFDGSSLEGKPLDKTPKHKLDLQLDWAAHAQWNLFAKANYASEQYWAAFRNGARSVRERPASTTFDLGGKYAISKNFDLTFAVLNVTDKIVPVDERSRNGGLDGNWMVDEGRRLAINLTGRI